MSDRTAPDVSVPSVGLLNLDKPPGASSRDVVNIVQRLVRPAKAGHAGTLDPLATGVLVVCVGAATRLIPNLLGARKTYRATFRFGVTSPTEDLEGEVTAVPGAPILTGTDIERVLPQFVGTIEQIPPAFSAVHIDGQRAYALARRGESVVLAPKTIEVYRFEPLTFDGAKQELDCEIECGSGTYIRSLGRDLGYRLGTGAVMTTLRRTAVGPFHVSEATSPKSLTRETLATVLQPPESGLVGFSRITLDVDQERMIRCGQFLPSPAELRLRAGEPLLLFGSGRKLVALAEIHTDGGTLRPKIVFPDH